MSNKRIDLPIENLAGGELQKQIERELRKIFDNIHDEETDATQDRGLTIKLKFIPDKERENIEVESEISTKLAKINGKKTKVITRRNPNTGQIEAKEKMELYRDKPFLMMMQILERTQGK